jgi:hypothetical protein
VPVVYTKSRYGSKEYDSIDLNYGKFYWFAQKHFSYHYENGVQVLESTFKWIFPSYASISKKFIKCVDDNCITDYADIFDLMECNSNYSPIDKSKDEHILYDFEDFKNYIAKTQYIPHWKSALAKITGTYIEVVINENDGLFTCSPKHYEADNAETLKELFAHEVTSRGYWGNNYRMIPVTIEELYSKLQPHYLNKYLVNGRFYERKY